MRILLTLDFPPQTGGIQRYLYDIVLHAYRAGDRVLFGSARRVATAHYAALPAAVEVVRAATPLAGNAFVVAALVPRLWRALAAAPGASVECGNVYAGLAAWLVSWVRPISYRVYTYGGELVGLSRSGIKAMVLKSVLRRAAGLYVLGSYTGTLVESLGVRAPTTVLPPRIEVPACCRHRRVSAGSGSIRVLCVARFVPHKGQRVLLQAMACLPAGLDWRLALVGQGDERPALEAVAARLGVRERVDILGSATEEELVQEYHRASLFVLPSLETGSGTEGFGIVLLEAMAHRVPIVGTRTGGIPEVLDHGSCGVLVDAGNPQALRDAIVRLSRDQRLRAELADRAYRRLSDHYAWRT